MHVVLVMTDILYSLLPRRPREGDAVVESHSPRRTASRHIYRRSGMALVDFWFKFLERNLFFQSRVVDLSTLARRLVHLPTFSFYYCTTSHQCDISPCANFSGVDWSLWHMRRRLGSKKAWAFVCAWAFYGSIFLSIVYPGTAE